MNLIRIGHRDPYDVIAAVETHEPRFGDLTWRQATAGSPHADTESIFLRMPPEISVHSVFHGLEVEDCPMAYDPVFSQALIDLEAMIGEPLARAMIVRMRPYGIIAPHRDEGTYAEKTNRWHYVITTNPECYCRVDGDIKHMKQGDVWFFNKHEIHAVANGHTPRIHMIVDTWMPDADVSN